MIKYKEVMVKSKEPISMKCNKCGKIITPKDTFEWQEIFCVYFRGEYGSVFGDGAEVYCELCQDCLKEVLGPYCKIA